MCLSACFCNEHTFVRQSPAEYSNSSSAEPADREGQTHETAAEQSPKPFRMWRIRDSNGGEGVYLIPHTYHATKRFAFYIHCLYSTPPSYMGGYGVFLSPLTPHNPMWPTFCSEGVARVLIDCGRNPPDVVLITRVPYSLVVPSGLVDPVVARCRGCGPQDFSRKNLTRCPCVLRGDQLGKGPARAQHRLFVLPAFCACFSCSLESFLLVLLWAREPFDSQLIFEPCTIDHA